MTDREKLVELLLSCDEVHERDLNDDWEDGELEAIADHLIANGVTVQRWIPVTERLPEPIDLVLCIGTRGGMFIGYHCYSMGCSVDKSICFHVPNSRKDRYASHWQPLPKPLKEEIK